MRFVILVLILLALIGWFQRIKKNVGRDRSSSNDSSFYGAMPGSAALGPTAAEAMVACAHCGMHFPVSEAITDSSCAIFCGSEHRRLHAS
jgi:uncharacterized protein